MIVCFYLVQGLLAIPITGVPKNWLFKRVLKILAGRNFLEPR